MAPYTTPGQLDTAYSTLHKTFKSGKTKSVAWRKWQLKQIWWMVKDNEDLIAQALHADLHRHYFESFFLEINTIKKDILAHINHVDEWAAGTLLLLASKASTETRFGFFKRPLSKRRLSCNSIVYLKQVTLTPELI